MSEPIKLVAAIDGEGTEWLYVDGVEWEHNDGTTYTCDLMQAANDRPVLLERYEAPGVVQKWPETLEELQAMRADVTNKEDQ